MGIVLQRCIGFFSVALGLSVQLCLSVALYSLRCFSTMLFPQASSALLYPYLQCVPSAATVAKVGPLATVNGLPIACAARL